MMKSATQVESRVKSATHVEPRVKSAIRVVSHIIILLIIIQALTGFLLTLHYVPDSGAAEVRNGVQGTIHYDSEAFVTNGDTLAGAGEYALVPAAVGDVVPSGAAASVSLTIEHHVSGGSVVRRVHHANTSAIIIAACILFVLLVVQRTWLAERLVWWVVLFGVVILLAMAYTGRLLPDDQYSYVSSQIVRHELSEFPFGSTLTALLGLDTSYANRLSTPYAIHAFLLPVIIAVGICLLWRRFSRPSRLSLFGCAIALVTGFAVSSEYYPVRDISNNILPSGTIHPWWPFAVPNTIVTWLGGELTGYLSMALFLVLMTLPLWARRTPD